MPIFVCEVGTVRAVRESVVGSPSKQYSVDSFLLLTQQQGLMSCLPYRLQLEEVSAG